MSYTHSFPTGNFLFNFNQIGIFNFFFIFVKNYYLGRIQQNASYESVLHCCYCCRCCCYNSKFPVCCWRLCFCTLGILRWSYDFWGMLCDTLEGVLIFCVEFVFLVLDLNFFWFCFELCDFEVVVMSWFNCLSDCWA